MTKNPQKSTFKTHLNAPPSKKKLKVMLILIGFLSLFFISINLVSAAWGSGGDGTVEDPYQIYNWTQLQMMDDADTQYILMNDLNYSVDGWVDEASPTANAGAGWTPVNGPSAKWGGVLNGNGYTISDLFIDRSAQYQGLFSYLGNESRKGLVYDLKLDNFTITGTGNTHGVLCGVCTDLIFNVSITNSYITGNDNYVGGLGGQCNANYINNSYINSTVTTASHIGGGLCGYLTGHLTNTYSYGKVTASTKGGLVGQDASGTITNSFYDNETSTCSDTGKGVGKLTAQMQDITTFSSAGWEIVNESDWAGEVWFINDGNDYPKLWFETFVPPSSELIINLLEPIEGYSIIANENTKFIASYNSIGFSLKNATYTIWFSNTTLYNQTTYSINSSNKTTKYFSIGFGNYIWNVYTCSENATQTYCVWANNNLSFEAGAEILSYSFPGNVSETEESTFTLNISLITGANLFAARLNYNGTKYLATKTLFDTTKYVLSRTINIPLIKNGLEQNISFFWEFEYKNGIQGDQNSSEYSHRVNPLIFQLCNATHTIKYWNVSVSNESTRNLILNTLDGSFSFWLGTGTVKKNYMLDSNSSTQSNYTFCANRENLNISAIINIKSDDFDERTFYFNKESINSSITQTILYLLDSGLGTSVIVEVTDPGLVQQVGTFVNVYRYYPEINDYLIIEKAKTDEFGQFVARLIEPNTVKYQFEFLNSNNDILKRTEDITIACRSSICVIPFVIEDDVDDFNRFSDITNFDYSLSFNNATNTFTYTWNDVTGNSITSRLLVQRIQFNGTTTMCNSTSTSVANTLTCAVGNSTAKYRAQAFRKITGEDERRIMVLNIQIGGLAGTFGLEGLFWAFILLFTLIGVGSFNPSVGVGLYTIGFIALGTLGIISMPIPIIFANLILGGIFIWAIRT